MNNLESLANELLLYLFEYFNDVHLIRAFYGLNSRFNHLLYSNLRTYHFDFRSIYKKDFYFICQEYIPLIIDRIISLHLSDADDTPNQLDLFLSFIPSFHQFIQLKSLSLTNIRDTYLINKLINSLFNLTHLNISACFLNLNLTYNIQLINIIWSLPKLIYCKLENILLYEIFLYTPTIKSYSLQYLIFDNISRNLIEFSRLCEYTPHLQYLKISIWDLHSIEELPFEFQSLNKLKLSFQGSLQVLTNILKSIPNLHCLIVKTQRIILSGYQWEQIIENYLPKLKIFRFLMEFSFLNENYQEQINELLQSFQTQFWLEKHQWFIEYYSNPYNENRLISLYTLPYFFDYFVYQNNMNFKSTCPNNEHHFMYNCVHSLEYDLGISKEISLYSPLNFSNIRNLYIDLPFNEHFWSIVPSINQLISLNIERFNNGKARIQLQTLLDRSPNLYSLNFKSPYFSPKLLFELKCITIRRLNLLECNHWFNKQQCIDLINSSFSKQCEIIFIKIKKRSNILQFIKKLNQLRTSIFQCEDDKWETEENHLIEWLYHHLSSTCSINRDINKQYIQIWIR